MERAKEVKRSLGKEIVLELVSPSTYGFPTARAEAISASNWWIFFTVVECVIKLSIVPPG